MTSEPVSQQNLFLQTSTRIVTVRFHLPNLGKCKKSKSKAIPLTGRGGLQGCEMLGIQHCLDNRLIDGSKVVGPTITILDNFLRPVFYLKLH
jgi:hypothetical protein